MTSSNAAGSGSTARSPSPITAALRSPIRLSSRSPVMIDGRAITHGNPDVVTTSSAMPRARRYAEVAVLSAPTLDRYTIRGLTSLATAAE